MKKLREIEGITLVALVITIIILLILVGITISSLTGSGLFGKAQDAVKLTKIREIEEAANLAYTSRQIDEFSKGETATIAGVISDLKAQEYNIEQRTSGSTTVIGIELNESNVRMNKDSEEILTYTLVYGEGTVRYFVEIDGKYYEMKFNNGTFTINTEETDLEGINQEPKVTAKSNVENIATAEKTEGKDEIVINSLNELGETTITIKEENSGIATVCNVKVMTLIESITFKQETINIEKGNNVELNALVTINPADTTETLIWTTENGKIVEIIEEGRLVGVKEGTTTIKVTNEDGTIEATCTVKVVISATGISLNKSTITINKGNTDTLTVAITPEDTTDSVNWTSENTSVVTITPDLTRRTATITAKTAGTSRITVTCGSKTAYCTVTVRVPATGLTISKETATIKVGDTLQLSATPVPSDTTDTITWKSSSSTIATVSNTGLVTGLKDGIATITLACGTGITKSCIVRVSSILSSNNSTHIEVDITSSVGWDNLKKIAKIISDNEDIITENTSEVSIKIEETTYKIGVGDTITMFYNNNKYKTRILGFNHDKLVNKSIYGGDNTYAGISFDFVTPLSRSYMHSSASNDLGWGSCMVRGDLNNNTYNTIISDYGIKKVKKPYIKTYNDKNSVEYSSDFLWLLSCSEIYSSSPGITNDGKQYKFFKLKVGNDSYNTINSWTKKPNAGQTGAETNRQWWLRTPHAVWSNSYWRVQYEGNLQGNVNNMIANYYNLQIAPGFSI
ncbi:MAG: hypothetical protein HFJ60_03510 [Clostridia bacterium]|jgi:uncharacterized protein YjdB/Tfp pilus assembly protein PilE|nr:hypothetical protein [Clostridia bacterium]